VEWRILHNEYLHDLYSSPNIVWVNKYHEMGGACDTRRGAYRVLAFRPVGKTQLRRSTRRRGWGDNIKLDLQLIWTHGVD